MKKPIAVLLLAAIITMTFSGCALVVSKPVANMGVTKSEAVNIALDAVGADIEKCKTIEAELDDGFFEIEFVYEGYEYTVMVDRWSGDAVVLQVPLETQA